MKHPINLFLDTNVWLSFYHYSSDDLEELRKLAVLIRQEEIKVLLTEQVKDEFRRNREVKIADAYKTFETSMLNESFPQICREYEQEYELMRKAARQYKEAKNKLLQKLKDDITNHRLKADTIIKELFQEIQPMPATRRILLHAWERKFRGNPPGKDKSNGDEINWEILLDVVEDGKDLYIIAEDSDYRSKFDDARFSPVLRWEWETRKRSKVFFYRKLSSFFKEKHPEIKLASELEKRILIDRLIVSPSFKITRTILKKLAGITTFTDDEVVSIAEAATSNSQIYLIGEDYDINYLIISILSGHESILDDSLKNNLYHAFKHITFDESDGTLVKIAGNPSPRSSKSE